MLFHKNNKNIKYLLLLLVFLVGCNGLNATLMRQKTIEEEVSQFAFLFMKKTSMKNNIMFDKKHNINKPEYGEIKSEAGNLKFEGLLLIASFRNNSSDEYLLRIYNFYIGEAPGAYLDDLILKRNKDILPVLEKIKKLQSECNVRLYECSVRDFDYLIERIKKQKQPNLNIDNIGDPFKYIPMEEISQRFNEFKSKVLKLESL